MDQELSQQNQSAEQQFKEVAKVENPIQLLKDSAALLKQFGGFQLIESCIDEARDLNPDKKATRNIFLTEASRKEERRNLKSTLELWVELLANNKSAAEIVTTSLQKAESADRNLKANLKKALDETRELEVSYRSLNLFYANTERDKLTNITIMNATPEQIRDMDTALAFKDVKEEFLNCFDKMDLRENYSLLVMPGYIGTNAALEKWARMAAEVKVMVITDFAHMDDPGGVVKAFQASNMASGDKFKANVMMACNYLVGRGKDAEVGEEEDVFIPPSSALAGSVYSANMAQITAGKKFGTMKEVDGVSFELKRTEFSELEKLGLIPMVNEYSKVLAMSGKTLFNGDNIGFQTYSVVRVFDWMLKSLMDFLNRRAFENFNVNSKNELKATIERFLDRHKGPGLLLEDFEITKFERDPIIKDKIYLDITLTPFFAAKQFVIGLDGQKGDGGAAAKWNSEVKPK